MHRLLFFIFINNIYVGYIIPIWKNIYYMEPMKLLTNSNYFQWYQHSHFSFY